MDYFSFFDDEEIEPLEVSDSPRPVQKGQLKRCFLNAYWEDLEMSPSISKWQMLPLWKGLAVGCGGGYSAPYFQAGITEFLLLPLALKVLPGA